ncbi:acyl-CoA dehydrogenase family protein [Streptomyces pseudovenezuelae]|uniref:hypothetical protein n=1 Tax=Streptomyces pseudovenezuelae TaxID=67350 RepID=UPI002E820B14|nr:hypothetical protein [Streptomyces pseudovenezuelae]WUA92952.1 hypothetical protein OHO81_38970 [Streptomyces pseudovenezuelae]
MVVEVARGCPSTGWALCRTAAHVLQVCTVFDETAQDELLGADGDFRSACTVAPVAPVGVARPDGPDHVVLDGTWPYSSGAPCSTHYVGQTLRAGDPPGPPVLFVAPRSVWTAPDDWRGALGLRGTGSQAARQPHVRGPRPASSTASRPPS